MKVFGIDPGSDRTGYGCIESDDPKAQLKTAEKWLRQHTDDAILLRLLGKLSTRNRLKDKAEQYLAASVSIEPSVDAYLCLGDVLAEQGEIERSNAAYRNGLLLASEEVVKQIDGVTGDYAVKAAAEAWDEG